MHEGAIVESIISTTLNVMQSERLKEARAIRIRIGKMHRVEVEVLATLFDLMKVEKPSLTNAQLVIEESEVEIRCRSCGYQSVLQEPFFLCPSCQSSEIDTIRGDEMILIGIEGER